MAIELIMEYVNAGKEVSFEVRTKSDKEIKDLEASLRQLRPKVEVNFNRFTLPDNTVQLVTRLKLPSPESKDLVLQTVRHTLESTPLSLTILTPHE